MFARYVISPSLKCINCTLLPCVSRTTPHVRNYVATRNTELGEFKRIVVLRKTINEKKSQHHVKEENYRHEYVRTLEGVKKALEARHLEYRIVERSEYTAEAVQWADLIVSAGGDGTFLWAASNVRGHYKPVIGFNTDPNRSAGHLCLPVKWSSNFGAVLDHLMSKKYRWSWRQRIRTTITGRFSDEPVELCDPQLRVPCQQLDNRPSQLLSSLALNEVFIAELIAGRVSYYDLSIDDGEPVRQKSSGITASTGTGSTSWFHSINRLSKYTVSNVLHLAEGAARTADDVLCARVAEEYNKSLYFQPSSSHMAFAIRDPIVNNVFTETKPRGFCNRLKIYSRMLDGLLVIDGARSYRFGEDATIVLEINSNDALRTIELVD